MSKNQSLQDKMFQEVKEGELFQLAEKYGQDYIKGVFDRNVYPSVDALENLSIFDEVLPVDQGDPFETLRLLNEYGSPGTTAQIGGRYFGFVHGGIIPVGLAAKIVGTFWDQNATVTQSSPISAKLESIVQKWLVELFSLPKETVAGFVSGTSIANFCALAAARYRILKNLNWDITKKGLFGAPKIRVVTGKEVHSSMLQAISLAGLGVDNIELVDVDDQGRISVDDIPQLDNTTILTLQAGNVNSGAFDNFAAICKGAREQGAWVHIDGAFGLWAGATNKFSHLTTGYEYANSWAVDAHKTLNSPYDSGIIFCIDEEALMASVHINAPYIPNNTERNGMYYVPEMSRRSRVIELWAILRYLGRNGIEELVDGLHERAVQFAELISLEKGFEVLNHISYNQVLVKCGTDQLTAEVLQEIQDLRECWVGGSMWHGHKVIRVSVCSWATTEDDVRRSVASFRKALGNVINAGTY